MTTMNPIVQESTPVSAPGGSEEVDQAAKKVKKRKLEKKAVPHSSTLHGLWRKPKSVDECSETTNEDSRRAATGKEERDKPKVTAKEPVVLKLTPSKLAAILAPTQSGTFETPPHSSPNIVPETPLQQRAKTPTTPTSSEQKKHSLEASPIESVRRSPRNHQRRETITPSVPAKKPHPFFLGKEARQALKASAKPLSTVDEIGEPSRKRRKSGSGDEAPPSTASTDPSSLLPPKQINTHASKSLHPFFMSRTASMESTGSVTSMPLLPLSQCKTVYLGNATPATFPPRGLNHIHEPYSLPLLSQRLSFKQKKGKTLDDSYYYHPSAYTSLTNIYPSTTFIPPEKLILPKSEIEARARALLTDHSHRSLLRAYQILTTEAREIDSDGQIWTHKFRPRRADEVLCHGSSAIDFRDWMAGDRKHIPMSIPKEMDDFIVDDDEREESAVDWDNDSISEFGDTPKKKKRKKVEKFTAYENVVILTGPNGVGKSAAVYAVAEELGYQVFEISPGSKRGGKELMEAVGEVGQSELVTKHKQVNSAPSISPIKNGETFKKARKGLICLEEVDVLYEEDRGFWSCVISLVEKSRRPVIMTCNDRSSIPPNIERCTIIDFAPAEPDLVRDYLQIITLAQGHIIDTDVLEKIYIESNRTLRQTLARLQFWCQFGVGDTRSGAEWINWDGKADDWVVSQGTITDGVEWRQEAACGPATLLGMVEDAFPDLDLETLFFPSEYYDEIQESPVSMFKRHKSTLMALDGIAQFCESMSFISSAMDHQFTVYEINPYENPSPDDMLSEPIIREHPGRRFEKPQGTESLLSPAVRIQARTVLDDKLRDGGYKVPPLSNEKIISQPVHDILNPRRALSRQEICDPLDELFCIPVLEDRYYPTVGILHSLDTIVTDLVPQIRHILRTEHQRRERKAEQLPLETLWANARKTRRRVKEEQEGQKKHFEDKKIDPEAVLKTWLKVDDIPGESTSVESMELDTSI